MTSRAQRLQGHRGAPPTFINWATDEIDGLGRLEQLVPSGDGLTTTSLEILAGHRIEVQVCGHRMLCVPYGAPAPPARCRW